MSKSIQTSLSSEALRAVEQRLTGANAEFAKRYPGESGRRQPVHTVYGGAHLFKSDSAERLGALARRSLDQFAPDFLSFARAIQLPGAEQLPDSLEQDGGLSAKLDSNPDAVRQQNKAAWLAHS